MRVGLLTIGNELLSGVTVNTNAAWLGQQLLLNGFPVTTSLVVGDPVDEIRRGLDALWNQHDAIITTGGLGPTHDDRTVEVIAEFFNSDLEFHEKTFERLKSRLAKRDIEITERHREQCMLPVDAEIIPNKQGTARAMYFEKEGKHAFCLPGVPHEMKSMVSEEILPRLKRLETRKVHTRIIRTVGVPESTLYNLVENQIEGLQDNMIAFLPHGYGVDIRLIADETDMNESMLDQLVSDLKATVGQPAYAEEDVPLAAVIGDMLRERDLTLATAESCTGGMLADEVTNISGSSDYFLTGYVTYSNEAKIRELSVPEELIIRHGAVSEQVAASMAAGAVKATGSRTALSTTGIAGPTGGTEEKPVGLVYIGCAIDDDVTVRKFEFSDDRRLNKMRSVYAALNLLRTQLLNG